MRSPSAEGLVSIGILFSLTWLSAPGTLCVLHHDAEEDLLCYARACLLVSYGHQSPLALGHICQDVRSIICLT